MLSHLLTSNDELTRKSRRLLLELKRPEKVVQSVNKDTSFSGGDDEWLSKVQDQMLDFPAQNAATKIVGQLYNRTLAAKRDTKRDKKSKLAARLPAPCWCHSKKLCTSEES